VVAVVVVAGLLAWSIRERVSPASTDVGGTKTLTSTVWTLRSQIALFKLQHHDQLPGVRPLVYNGGPSGADASTFWDQMTQYTDVNGNTSSTKSARFCYGPYIQSAPVNNLNGSKTIAPAPAKGVGFVYDFAGGTGTGKIWGVGPSGALVGG
jgi:hypothetical protein